MAPYDSDSSDDDNDTQKSYTETDVLLGYAQEEANGEVVSRLGGRPDWLLPDQPPSAALARCRVCQGLMVLLLQLNGELPDRFPNHERRLYVFACRNKACRRKQGSIRAVRAVRLLEAAEGAAAAAAAAAPAEPAVKMQKAAKEKPVPKPAAPAPVLGESLFGVSNPFAASAGGSSSNPFSMTPSSSSSMGKNPFSIGGTPAAAAPAAAPAPAPAAKPPQPASPPAADLAKDLPKTFAETLSLNNNKGKGEKVGAGASSYGPPPPPEPWPPAASWPEAYPVSWIADAEFETLDPTPEPRVPTGATMELDDGPGGGGSGSGGSSKEDKYIFESSMDAAFQKFADRTSQNPEQVIRYEFAGQPLLYSKEDSVGKLWHPQGSSGSGGHITIAAAVAALPPCPSCRARRVFEVQLMPHAIGLLEADELGLEGMDWGTVLVGVCEKDCQARGTAAGEASYLEEWAGVQWEDLESKR